MFPALYAIALAFILGFLPLRISEVISVSIKDFLTTQLFLINFYGVKYLQPFYLLIQHH